jgi:hypothetical protein
MVMSGERRWLACELRPHRFRYVRGARCAATFLTRGVDAVAELIHEHSTSVQGEDGTTYVVRVWADRRRDGTWEGWLEFDPADVSKDVLRTGRETSQPNRAAVDYWASGLEPVYMDGAFARAQGRLP